MTPVENREFKRVSHEAPLRYAFRNSDTFFSVTMCNYCDQGMCFISGYELEPGSEINIMPDEDPRADGGHSIQDHYQAKVKWCRPLQGTDAFFYKVGVQYRKPSLPE